MLTKASANDFTRTSVNPWRIEPNVRPTSAVSILDALAEMTRASGLSSRFSIATGSMGRRVSMDDPRKRENAESARFKLTKCIPVFLGGTHGAWSILCALTGRTELLGLPRAKRR
jgi:hypothetical protein